MHKVLHCQYILLVYSACKFISAAIKGKKKKKLTYLQLPEQLVRSKQVFCSLCACSGGIDIQRSFGGANSGIQILRCIQLRLVSCRTSKQALALLPPSSHCQHPCELPFMKNRCGDKTQRSPSELFLTGQS